MKSIKVIVIGFILAIALVAWPVEYTRNITAGTGFLLGGVLGGLARDSPPERRTEGIRG
mgnify:CR=1 FL=1